MVTVSLRMFEQRPEAVSEKTMRSFGEIMFYRENPKYKLPRQEKGQNKVSGRDKFGYVTRA